MDFTCLNQFLPRTFSVWMLYMIPSCLCTYMIDDTPGLGRTFGGIGAISGGGATSKLLMNYAEPYRSQILDYLFKPNFGASLQMLKVEIGGDSQSSDGSEASHMHSADDESYVRGYEWWLMTEAKKRNPDIKFYGLPWVWPGWLGGGKFNPFSNITNTVKYITNWITGAKKYHNLTIDYIGIWNERPYDVNYIKLLRSTLNKLNLQHVNIVVADGEWGIVPDLMKDPDLLDAVDIIGVHYPGSHSPDDALILERPLWASEEYSAYNDLSGGGCWARVLNEGYVNGLLSATIAWNLISAYYDNLPYTRSGLMTANQPWSGAYEVSSPIWMSAHFTQFTSIGWQYLSHGWGVGNLTSGGSYTAMTNGKDLSIFVVTMDPTSAHCFYSMPKYKISTQKAIFQLAGSFAKIDQLNLWYSKLDFVTKNKTEMFQKKTPVKVTNGTFSLNLQLDEVYTLTTLSLGNKGSYGNPPPSKDFPVPYKDDFQNYTDSAEPFNFAQQAGSFEVRTINITGKPEKAVMQAVPEPPVDTCRPTKMTKPVIVMGNHKWSDIDFSVDFLLVQNGSSGAFIGARVSKGGCETATSNGIFLWILGQKTKHGTTYNMILTEKFTRSVILGSKAVSVSLNKWYTLGLTIKGNQVSGSLGGKEILSIPVKQMSSHNGFVALGTETFQLAYFNNFKINSAKVAETLMEPNNMHSPSRSNAASLRRHVSPNLSNVVHMRQN